jgi:hypothetical protein
MKKLELREDELNELIAKVANEIEIYGDEFSEEIYNVFIKLLRLNPSRKSLLVQKYEYYFTVKT